jgi:hypothetical protein
MMHIYLLFARHDEGTSSQVTRLYPQGMEHDVTVKR